MTVCQHGQLARVCERCEDAREIARLQALVETVQAAERAHWQRVLELQQASYEREIELEVGAERERCCRLVAVQSADDGSHVAKRTILAIRAGDDFLDADADVADILRA
jgi:hypothetical protein